MVNRKYSPGLASKESIDTVQTFIDNSESALSTHSLGVTKYPVESRWKEARNVAIASEEEKQEDNILPRISLEKRSNAPTRASSTGREHNQRISNVSIIIEHKTPGKKVIRWLRAIESSDTAAV